MVLAGEGYLVGKKELSERFKIPDYRLDNCRIVNGSSVGVVLRGSSRSVMPVIFYCCFRIVR